MRLKLGGQLDYEVVQAYCYEVTVHQILIVSLLFKDDSNMTSFPANSSYSFHRIGLKLSRQLDHKGYSAYYFEVTVYQILTVITILKTFQT